MSVKPLLHHFCQGGHPKSDKATLGKVVYLEKLLNSLVRLSK